MERSNKAVQQLRASYSSTTCPIPTILGSNLHAFLAPALREALAASSFASRTRVVPGEADDWCALRARSNERSIIFTSDTDLILFDYGPETLIVFLHDADPSAGLKAYSPVQIRQKMQLRSLVSFAFALHQEPWNTANDIIRKARNVDLASEEYLDLSKRYCIDTVKPVYLSGTSVLSLQLQYLDVRVSEFVYEARIGSSIIFVYLPILVEDPNQTSAWAMGQDIRTLAYSLLTPENSIIHEHKRKAQGIVEHKIHPYSVTNVQTPAAELNRQISALEVWATSKTVAPEVLWPLFALSLALAEMNTPPSLTLVLRVLNGDFDNTWTFIQLIARIQATLYSLRMLKQIIKAWLANNEQPDTKLLKCISTLDEHFSTFPSITAMFTVLGQKASILAGHDELKGLVEEIYVSAGLEIPKETPSNKKKKKQAREAHRKSKRGQQSREQPRVASNAFSMLQK